MARSVLTPLRINGRGGISMTPKDDGGARSLRQVIAASLVPGASQHPYALAEGRAVPGGEYNVANASGTSNLRSYVRRRFEALEAQGRARLVDLQIGPTDATGRQVGIIRYQNLEQGGRALETLDTGE